MYAVNFGGRFLLFLTRSKSNSKSLQKGNLARLIELFDSDPGLHPVPKLRNKVLYCCSKRVHCQLFYFEIEFSLDKVLRTYFKEKLLLVISFYREFLVLPSLYSPFSQVIFWCFAKVSRIATICICGSVRTFRQIFELFPIL